MRVASLQIQSEEYRARQDRLRHYLEAEGLSGAVCFDPSYILYYTGFAFIPTERPMAFLLNSRGERFLFVPRLEQEHASANAQVDEVETYLEYPGEQHPMHAMMELMNRAGIRGNFGADRDGALPVMGYRGPSLSQLTGAMPFPIRDFIEEEMMVKSTAELALIRESVRWGNLAHALLQRYTRVGLTETEASQRASQEATQAMLDAIGPVYRACNPYYDGAMAGYRGQIGRNAAIPHALANNIVFQPGDVLVSGAGAPVWGYQSELERTMIIGSANAEQERLFDHMLKLQETAMRAIRPGARCADVDRAVRSYYEEHGLWPLWKHHSGHAIGLREHEAPFLDIGDQTVIRAGMVFTVEPGLYAAEIGGFRHSDTVVVTEDGIEILTYYPRDLQSLTLPI